MPRVVALVGGAPEGTGDGINGFADAVTQAAGVDFDELAVGGVGEDVGAVELAGVGVGVVYVGAGAYGDEEVLVVLGKDDVAGPVAAAAKLGVAGDVGDDGLRLGGGVEVAIFVGEALDGGGVADVDVLRVGAGGIEGDAEGVVEASGEFLDGGGAAVGSDAAEDEDGAGAGVGQEEVAVGGSGDEARLGERAAAEFHVLGGVFALEGRGVTAGVEGDAEARGGDGEGVDGAGDYVGPVVDGFRGVGCREVGGGDFVADAGVLLVPVGECGLAGEKWRLARGVGRSFLGEGGGDAEGESEESDPLVHGQSLVARGGE